MRRVDPAWALGLLFLACAPREEASSTGPATTGSGSAATTVTGEVTSGEQPTQHTGFDASCGSACGTTCGLGCGGTWSADLASTADLYPPTCDPFGQDCPPGQKCAPYGDSGGLWDSTRCIPVAPDPAQLGEPCVIAGDDDSGVDDCDVGAFCWDGDGEDLLVCAPLCAGSIRDKLCPEGHYCAYYSEWLAVCERPSCDPLVQDCAVDGEVCLPNIYAYDDWCVYDDSAAAGLVHAPCDGDLECAGGLVCVVSEYAAVECGGDAWGCCEPFCEVGVDPCPGAGQECLVYYTISEVGVCLLP